MGISRRSFLTGALALTGCGAQATTHRQRWYLFGTLVDVTVAHPDESLVSAAMQRLAALFGDIHHNLHAWKPGALQRINRAIARGESIAVDARMQAMIVDIRQQHVSSGGAFNPAVGELVGLWGFHGDTLPTGHPPSRAGIDRLVAAQPSPLDIQVRDGLLSCANPHVQLDLGGYGKGYALDLGMALLRAAGLHDAIINAGGDLNVSGGHGGTPWRVAVRHPRGSGALAWLETAGDEAIYTSGNYERYLEFEGKRYAHIIDPRDGMPVGGTVSATVIHPQGGRADAAATALTVAGSGWRSVAESLGVDQVMVVDRLGNIQATPTMAQRITLPAGERRRIAVV
jgi:thiamine biosynthesis lipoprotein